MSVLEGGALAHPLTTHTMATTMARGDARHDRHGTSGWRVRVSTSMSPLDGSVITTVGRRRKPCMTNAWWFP